jgi:hypothetical protein
VGTVLLSLSTPRRRNTSTNQFKDTFQSIIVMNETVSNIERYHYLISSLEDEPRQLLQNLPITNDNFEVAWELIYNNRYDKKNYLC